MRRSAVCIVSAVVLCGGVAASSCSAPIGYVGTIKGHLLIRTGALGVPDKPIAGTVIIGTPKIGHYGVWIPVNSSGVFKSLVLTGTYPISGHSPAIGSGRLVCTSSPGTVTITKGSTVVRNVICHAEQSS